MADLCVYPNRGNRVIGKRFRGSNKLVKKGKTSGLKFFAEINRGKAKYHCYFRGVENSGGRSEQYFVEYRGQIESFRELARDVGDLMREEHENFEFDKKHEDDFLYDLVGVSEYRRLNSNKIKRNLRKGNTIEFKVGSNVKAASLVKALMDIETHSGDKHATIGVTTRNFPRNNKPEIAIKLNDSINGIKGPNIEGKTQASKKQDLETNQNSSTESWGSKSKPSGPGEWVKSKIPFV